MYSHLSIGQGKQFQVIFNFNLIFWSSEVRSFFCSLGQEPAEISPLNRGTHLSQFFTPLSLLSVWKKYIPSPIRSLIIVWKRSGWCTDKYFMYKMAKVLWVSYRLFLENRALPCNGLNKSYGIMFLYRFTKVIQKELYYALCANKTYNMLL